MNTAYGHQQDPILTLDDKSWMPTVAGILDICAGLSCLIGSAVLAFLAIGAIQMPEFIADPVASWPFEMGFLMFMGLAVLLGVQSVFAILGGLASLRHARGFWPILGAIAATLCCLPFGVAAIVLTVMYEHHLDTRPQG